MVYNQVQRCESGRGEPTHLAVDSALLQQVKQLVANDGLEVQESLGDAVVEVPVDPAARIASRRGVRAGSCDGQLARLWQHCVRKKSAAFFVWSCGISEWY